MGTCSFHGYDSLACPACRKEHAAQEALAVKEGRAAYYVVAWRGDGAYRLSDALTKSYKRRSAAQARADRINNVWKEAPGGYVVRLLCTRES